MKRIDTHQHLAFRDRFSYPWMAEFPPLDEDRFHLADYWKAAEECGIQATVFMENDAAEGSGIDEARHACRLASDPRNRILGVIASARPEKDGFAAHLESIADPKLVGIRRILHTQPDELSRGSLFRENIQLLGKAGLPFDLCVLQRQLPLAIELVRACPDTTFVVDHCGVPDIANNAAPHGDGWRQWQRDIRALAEAPNATCKVSGIILYAGPSQRDAAGLRPYVEQVIEAFGWERVVWGGDWPVCTLGGSLVQWCRIIDEILAGESGENKARLFSANASATYGLQG